MFTIKDLKNGDCVRLKNGLELMYVNECLIDYLHCYKVNLYLDDMTYRNRNDSSMDIIQVCRWHNGHSSIRAAILYGDVLFDRNKDVTFTWNGLTMEKAHRRMWNDFADGKVKSKSEWFNEWKTKFKSTERPENLCFACEEAKHRSINDDYCLNCPIGEYTNESGCLDGLYDKWYFATGFEKFKFAHDIANLEWKENEK